MTQACAVLAQRAASPGTRIESWSNIEGPPAVDSMYADYMAGRPLVLALAALSPLPDAIVLGGFGNYGTGAVKEASRCPWSPWRRPRWGWPCRSVTASRS